MSSSSSPIEHEDFWFEDGDVALSVTEDGVEHRFRVHRLILKMESPVFRHILSMQPSGDEDLRVPLPEDSVQDVTALLGHFGFPPSKCSKQLRKAQDMTLDVALGILRLSRKYQMEGIHDKITRNLLEDWPLNHRDYLRRPTFLRCSGNRIPQALKIINAAQHCQANELLPTAYYELACAWRTRWEEIASSLSLENVTRLSVGRACSSKRLRTFLRDKKTPQLMWNSEKISKPITIFQCRDKEISACRERKKYGFWCSFEVMFSSFCTKLRDSMVDGGFPLAILQQFRREDISTYFCEVCKDWFMEVLANKTRELWESIPDDFNLPKNRQALMGLQKSTGADISSVKSADSLKFLQTTVVPWSLQLGHKGGEEVEAWHCTVIGPDSPLDCFGTLQDFGVRANALVYQNVSYTKLQEY
ncbi:hypothetical protein JB92DRAFT_3209486 [Gautieria morchelliformis]|nr:hypothetical protein JB92DRAFT_3209486 [Gautieria morchelliformis]